MMAEIMNTNTETQDICCPPFDPALWDQKIIEWENKKFIKTSVKTFFFMPLNFGGVMRKIFKQVKHAETDISGSICLSDHTSKWNMDLYIAVDKEVQGLENTTLSGKFFCKVYEGPFTNTRKWCDDYKEEVRARNLMVKKWYMWYTTCPKCAKKYGKNYVAVFCRVE